MATGMSLALIAVVLWSTNAVAAKIMLTEATVTQILALQFSAAAVTLFVMHAVLGAVRPSVRMRNIRMIALGIIGILGTISFQYIAFRYSPIVQANIIAYGWPLYAAIWWAITRWSRDGLWFVIFGVAGFIGVALVVGGGQSFAFSGEFLVGYAFAVASALCMAFYTLTAGRLENPGPSVILPATLVGAAVTMLLAINDSAAWPPIPYILLGVYIGVGPMALGYFLWMRAMSRGNAPSLIQIGFLTPLLSTLWLLAMGETLSNMALLGAVFIIGASIAAVLYERAGQRVKSTGIASQGGRRSPQSNH